METLYVCVAYGDISSREVFGTSWKDRQKEKEEMAKGSWPCRHLPGLDLNNTLSCQTE